MPTILTHDELYNLIKQKGEPVLAITTEKYEEIPQGTKLWFGATPYHISSADGFTKDKNKIFEYNFKYQWNDYWRYVYKGNFELVEDEPEKKEQPKFKVGDKVRVKAVLDNGHGGCNIEVGDIGVILSLKSSCVKGLPIKFDRNVNGHSCGGLCMNNYGQDMLEDELELVIEEQEKRDEPLTNTIITNIKDADQHRRVQEKLFGMGINSVLGKGKYIEETSDCIVIDTDNCGCFWIRNNTDISEYTTAKRIPASEFLGEDLTKTNICSIGTSGSVPGTTGQRFTEGETIKVNIEIDDRPFTGTTYKEVYAKKFEEITKEMIKNYKINTPNEPCVKGKNKIMENIVSFFNDLTVSAEDKELRKAGLKNNSLEWTPDALQIAGNLKAKQSGYKDWADMNAKVGHLSHISILEADSLFKEFYSKLLETAKKFNRKDEKKANK